MTEKPFIDDYEGDAGEYLALQSKVYVKLNYKYEKMIGQLLEMYSSFVRKGVGMKSVGFQKQEQIFNEYDEEEFKKQPDLLIDGISQLMNSLFQVTTETLNKLNSRDDALQGAYDEVLLRLEKELRQSMKNEEKLKIHLECLTVKQESLRKQVFRAEEISDKLRQEVASTKKEYQNKFRQMETEIIHLKKEKESAKSMLRKFEASRSIFADRPHTSNQGNIDDLTNTEFVSAQKVKIADSKGTSNQFDFNQLHLNNYTSMPSTLQKTQGVTSSLDPERFILLKKSLIRQPDEASNMEKKKLSHQVMQANRSKEVEAQKYQYEINRLRIQIEQKELENKKIKKSLDELHNELKKLKDEIMAENMKKWAVEVSSEKNPHLVGFYKDKLDQKEKEVKNLKKSQKKFAILEKKLLVKEKAFEYERADYHEKLLYLDERVKKISKLYSEASQILKQPKYGYTPVYLQENNE
ncbi:hypothetical protein ABPG72_001882 [Tetrahymena utriculariae]